MFSPPSLQALPHPKCDLEDITLGINRVRFLKDRISPRNNPLFRHIQTTRTLTTQARPVSPPQFIVSVPRPKQKRPGTNKAKQNPQIAAQQLKELKKCWNIESERRKHQQKLSKIIQCRNIRKRREAGRARVKQFHEERQFRVKDQRLFLQSRQLERSQNQIKEYERYILAGQKMKEFLQMKALSRTAKQICAANNNVQAPQ